MKEDCHRESMWDIKTVQEKEIVIGWKDWNLKNQ